MPFTVEGSHQWLIIPSNDPNIGQGRGMFKRGGEIKIGNQWHAIMLSEAGRSLKQVNTSDTTIITDKCSHLQDDLNCN